jgi:hypothetical protein
LLTAAIILDAVHALVRPMSHYMDSAGLKLVKAPKLTRLSLTSGTGSQIE